jgi:hypothetical protein
MYPVLIPLVNHTVHPRPRVAHQIMVKSGVSGGHVGGIGLNARIDFECSAAPIAGSEYESLRAVFEAGGRGLVVFLAADALADPYLLPGNLNEGLVAPVTKPVLAVLTNMMFGVDSE